MSSIVDPAQPRTAEELNGWLNRHFAVFVGTPRAYFELPIKDDRFTALEGAEIDRIQRWVYVTVAVHGEEGECVRTLYECLSAAMTLEELEDASLSLFMRRMFEYTPPRYEDLAWETKHEGPKWTLVPGRLSARLTFWDEKRNVMFAPHIRADGTWSQLVQTKVVTP